MKQTTKKLGPHCRHSELVGELGLLLGGQWASATTGGTIVRTVDSNGLHYVYDAWGRVTTVKDGSGTMLESTTYDGTGKRLSRTVGSTTTELYHSAGGQTLE